MKTRIKKEWMTGRERIEATLLGQERDRLTFDAKYYGWNEHPFVNWTRKEVLEYIGADPINLAALKIRYRNPKVEVNYSETATEKIRVYTTPDGLLTEREEIDPATKSWHPVEFPIKSLDDIRAARYLYENAEYFIEKEDAVNLKTTADEGSDEFFCFSNPPSPLMELVEYKAGITNLSYFLLDYPEEMEELIGLMQQAHMRQLAVIVDNAPRSFIRTVENTSTTLISPALFEQYAFPHLSEYGNYIEQNGKNHILHMCGHIKELLPKINEIPACAIEAFQATPVGNTNLVDGVSLCPTKALIGGIAGTVWTLPDDEIVGCVSKNLEEAGDISRVCLGNAGGLLTKVNLDRMRYIWGKIRERFE